MIRRFIPLLVAWAVLLLAIACEGGPAAEPTSSAIATPAPTVAPTPTPEIPDWLSELIQQMASQPVANPPAHIARYDYRGQTVYFLPQRCCDILSNLYNAAGDIIAHPDGGVTGQGDGRAPDFFEERRNEQIIWRDQRTNFQTVESGQSSGIELEAPQLFAIETQVQWGEFWRRHTRNITPSPPVPAVDFDQEMVIAVVDKLQSTGGYTLEITGVVQLADRLEVQATRTEPRRGCAVTEAETQPFHMIRLPKSDLVAVLSVTSVKSSC